jgi:thymidylate synthase
VQQYLNLLQSILDHGETVPSGAFLPSENRQPHCKTILAAQYRHDLAQGFPAVTTKKLYFDTVVDELLWFLRGETNISTLGRTGPDGEFIKRKIWDQWATEAGDVKNVYGYQWRYWPYPSDKPPYRNFTDAYELLHWDQVDRVVKDLKAVVTNPFDRARRRVILTGWNPPEVPTMGLPPCHTAVQFLVTKGRLDAHCFWRSIDMFVGFPFNIAQYALLTHILAGLVGLKPGTLVASISDCHLYDNQFEAVKEQLGRIPLAAPELLINPEFFKTAPDLSIEQLKKVDPSWFSLYGYTYNDTPLKVEVAR